MPMWARSVPHCWRATARLLQWQSFYRALLLPLPLVVLLLHARLTTESLFPGQWILVTASQATSSELLTGAVAVRQALVTLPSVDCVALHCQSRVLSADESLSEANALRRSKATCPNADDSVLCA